MGESEDDSSTPILANNSANIGNNDSNDCEIVMSRRIHLETIEKPMITHTSSSFLRELKISRGVVLSGICAETKYTKSIFNLNCFLTRRTIKKTAKKSVRN